MNKLFKLTGSGKPKRSRSKQHKQTRYRYVTKAAVSFMAPLLFVGALTLPQIAQSANENVSSCTLSNPGTIGADGTFSENPSGIDFKITCAGALADRLDEYSIESILIARDENAQYDLVRSKTLLDLTAVTGQGLSFSVTPAKVILDGMLTNGESLTDRAAVGVYTEAHHTHDIDGENRATILVKGDGRRAITAYRDEKDESSGDVTITNSGSITTEGNGCDRKDSESTCYDSSYTGSNPDRRADGIQAATDHEAASGAVVLTNKLGATVHVKGSGAIGINAYNKGSGKSEVHNYGTVITNGALWQGYEPIGIVAGSRKGDATAVNYKGGTITTGVANSDDPLSGRDGHAVHASAGGSNIEASRNAVAENHGTITTYGHNAHGVNAYARAVAPGKAVVNNSGTITTMGETAHGMTTYVNGDSASALSTEGTNSGMIRTEGDGADGMQIFPRSSTNSESNVVVTNSGSIEVNGNHPSDGIAAGFWMNRDSEGGPIYSDDSLGTVTVTNTVTGTVTTTGDGEKLEDGDIDFVAAIAGGFWARQGNDERPGNVIENSGDAIIINDGEVIASGHRTAGLFGRTVGSGTLKITTRGDIHAGTMGEKFGIGIWGGAFTDGEVRNATTSDDESDDVDVMIVVEGSTINAYGAATDDPDSDYDESNGIAILTGSGPKSGHAVVTINNASVSAYGKDGGYAVLFDPGRGTLNLSDSTIVGNIEFVGSDDDVLNISGSKTTSITGDIMGLEMLNKNGTGAVRFNGDVNAESSMLNLNEGSLIIAGKLDLKDGTLTVKQAGKLVFEVKSTSEHGSLSAESVHFEQDQASVYAQLNAGLSSAEVSAVQAALVDSSITLLDVEKITSGSGNTEVDSIMLQSQSGSTVSPVGMVSSDGMASFDPDMVNMVSVLDLSGGGASGGGMDTEDEMDSTDGGSMMDTSDGDSTDEMDSTGGETATSGGSSSSSGGVILGVGLLAVLMSTFMADEDASASFGDYYFNTPQSAYIAKANERGVLTIKETGNQPYQMWIRTGQTAQPMRMTGVSNSGVSGTEVGFNLYNSDTFYINTSVAPNVAAEVGSLNLAAKGEVYSLSSGWRNDRYFGGLRLSHGEFEVNSIVDNPIVNSALISNAKLRNTQAQLRAGMNLSTGALRFTPSASIQVGTYENSEHIAESPALEATIPSYAQDYTSVQLGLKMTSDKWLSFTNGSKWKPQLKFDSIHTDSKDTGSLTLRQSDKAGALSFNTNAGLRSMPDVVNSMSFGAKVKSSTNNQAEWKFGFAGLEADGEEYYAAMAGYQLRF